MTDPRALGVHALLPPLPAVAVVDSELVARRRRRAKPARLVGASAVGLALGVGLNAELPLVVEWLLAVVAPAGAGVAIWALPWSGARPPGVAETLLRRGFSVGLQGTSMSASVAAELIGRVRSAHPPAGTAR